MVREVLVNSRLSPDACGLSQAGRPPVHSPLGQEPCLSEILPLTLRLLTAWASSYICFLSPRQKTKALHSRARGISRDENGQVVGDVKRPGHTWQLPRAYGLCLNFLSEVAVLLNGHCVPVIPTCETSRTWQVPEPQSHSAQGPRGLRRA